MIKVINYHYIREDFSSAYPSIFGVTPAGFKRQLNQIKDVGDFISPSDFINSYKDIVASNDNFYFITFDDGLKEQFDLALPILDEFNIQAIFFANSLNSEQKKVSTVHKIHLLRSILPPNQILTELEQMKVKKLSDKEMGKALLCYRFDNVSSAELKYLLNFKIPLDLQESLINSIFKKFFDETEIVENLYMRKNQIQTLSDLNCLGSHSHSHYPLGRLEEDRIKFELVHSKEYFEKITKNPITMVAYPYGTADACTETVAEIAKKNGYLFGFTTKKGIVDKYQNNMLLNRFDCNDVIGGKNFKK